MPRSEPRLPKSRWINLSQGALWVVLIALVFWKFPWHSWLAIVAAAAQLELEVISQRPRGLQWRWIFANLGSGLLALALVWWIAGADDVIYFRIQDALEEDITSIVVLVAGVLTVFGLFLLLWQIGYTLLRGTRPNTPRQTAKVDPAPTVAGAPPPSATRQPAAPVDSGPPYQFELTTLELAYAGGTMEQNGAKITFSTREIGMLEITTGQVAASDPLVEPNPAGFTRAVPNGRYPVRLAIANLNGDERVGYAQVMFSGAAPVRWEMALIDGQDLSTLEKGEFFGYGVDAGTGCFMDPRAGQLLNARMDRQPDYADDIINDMQKSYAHTRSWLDFRPDPEAPENVICFSTGFGDGRYPSFFGLDAAGKVAVLVTDFFVAGEE